MGSLKSDRKNEKRRRLESNKERVREGLLFL